MITTANSIPPHTNVRPLRILHYVPAVRLEQGGVVRSILDWCTVLSQRGHQISLAVYESKDVPQDWLDAKPDHPCAHILPKPMAPLKLLNAKAMQEMDALLAETDVLHLHGPWLDGNRQIANLARKRRIPYVLSTHGMLDDWSMDQRGWKKSFYMSLVGRRVLNHAALLHFTADAELSQASKWHENPNTTVLPYLVDLTLFADLPDPDVVLDRLPTEARALPKILFLSRLHEQKGVDILIGAAALLRDASVPFVVMLAGNGDPAYETSLRSLVSKLKLQDRVLFLGLITGTEKLSLYRAADLFVLPTRHENFGLVLIEAMACGLPVVTTNGTDIWREIQSAGAIIADSTPAGFAAEIQRLLNDSRDRNTRGTKGRDWVFTDLAVELLSQKYEALYRKLIIAKAGDAGV